MSKKRKTRKQKEQTSKRIVTNVVHQTSEIASYSVSVAPRKEPAGRVKLNSTEIPNEAVYLRKDIISISAASGIILASEILLFLLLTSGILKLNFLGY